MKYAKAIVAAIGTVITVLLGIVPAGTPTWNILTGIAGVLTIVGVHQIPNAAPAAPAPVTDPTDPTTTMAG